MMASRARRRSWINRGLLTPDGSELTPQGERFAEYEAEARAGYWDPPGDDSDRFTAPDPYPGGGLI